MKTIKIIFVILILTNLLYSQEFNFRDVVTGLDTPWEILWGPDGDIWLTERYGRISKVNPQTGKLTELITISQVYEDGERGLMGMVLHPDFQNNPYVYTVFNYKTDKNETFIKLIRLTYDGEKLKDSLTLIDGIPGAWNHDGSRLIIDNDLTLYMTIGDAAQPNTAQDLNSKNGKILRLNLDGSIPTDNPYPNSYVWTWGHRNPQGLIKANGILYSSEHGPSNDDELNIIIKSKNYGWPLVEGFCDKPQEIQYCQQLNIVEPIAAWTPTLAVAGIDYYNHNLITEWQNSILMVVLKSSRLVQLKLSQDYYNVIEENHYFINQFGRLRDICISPDGKVFIATSNKDGRGNPKPQDDRIIEITPIATDIRQNKDSGFNIYPNPAKDQIIFETNDYQQKKISIYNTLGQIITEKTFTGNFFRFDRTKENLTTGIYIIHLKTNNESITKQIIFID